MRELVTTEGTKRAVPLVELKSRYSEVDVNRLMHLGLIIDSEGQGVIVHDLIAQFVIKDFGSQSVLE